MCGHATLASAYVIFTYLDETIGEVIFRTRSGILEVSREENLINMIFTSREGAKCKIPKELIKGLGRKPEKVFRSRDYLAVFEKEEEIINLNLNWEELKKLDGLGVIVTAEGEEVDFVSRFFAPKIGINEDPVTGSAHCTLVLYWKVVLGKHELVAVQLYKRGGRLFCADLGSRVKISGEAVSYLEGYINI